MRRICSGIVFALALVSLTVTAHAQVICISNNVPPPELPVYDQPAIPEPGYIWTPGYWAGGPSGYFWVPGTWVEPPEQGLLWTPGYWSWRDGVYIWTAGYWGPHVGFYGGIDYGYGYTGDGYEGGRWDNGVFAYNRSVNNFGDVQIVNVYERPVFVNQTDVRVSFNGGSGGIMARPTPQEESYRHEQHVAADQAQLQHERIASADKSLLASENHGRPTVAATAKPGDFTGKGVVAAREATPVNPAQTKPAGVGPGAPNPAVTRLPEGKPLEGKPLEVRPLEGKPLERGQPNANLNGATPPRPLPGEAKPLTPEGKPLAPEGKPLESKLPEKHEGSLNGTTPTKPLPGEGKPLTPETRPLTPAETKPVDTGRKLPESGPANHESRLPPPTEKPVLTPAPKAPTPPAPPPHVAITPPPHPAPPAAPAAHPPGPQNAKPDPKDRKPPG